jgi:hypothetical protein
MSAVIHAIRNHLAVVIASVEAFRDGVLEPSPARLTAVLQEFAEIETLLRAIPREVAREEPRHEGTSPLP